VTNIYRREANGSLLTHPFVWMIVIEGDLLTASACFETSVQIPASSPMVARWSVLG
jgi:hypothetical protein